ncbi:transcription factor C6 [Aspergillus fumigatus]|nr:transcription factor C6 [Aspergillus fumigatus]
MINDSPFHRGLDPRRSGKAVSPARTARTEMLGRDDALLQGIAINGRRERCVRVSDLDPSPARQLTSDRAMSPSERNILVMAKASARKHLVLISSEPDFYLAKLKYAMDFVWAKCAFCFLLLLKLSRLLPERKEEHQELLEHGNRLLSELTKSADSHGNTNGSSKIYLQILKLSIEKYGRAVQESGMDVDQAAMVPFWELFDAQADLQSFVPEQFVTEWDFPGLNLFYFPTAWQDFFGDFSLAI